MNVLDAPCPAAFAPRACQVAPGGINVGSITGALGQTNVLPLGFFSQGVSADQPFFGVSDGAMAGRVVQLQARFSF